MKKKKRVIRVLQIIAIILVLLFIGFLLWVYLPHKPMAETAEFLEDTSTVEVHKGEYISFLPKQPSDSNTGLILYPGARVNPESYGRIAKELADQGVSVFIVDPIFRLAILSINDAKGIIGDNPDIENWYVGGHSLGGSSASIFAYDNEDLVEGVIFLASYPLDKHDYTTRDIRVLSIYGSEDTFATVEEIESYDDNMPDDYTKVPIEGGNHSQFGYYGHQKGDGQATISREQQQEIIIDAIGIFLRQ